MNKAVTNFFRNNWFIITVVTIGITLRVYRLNEIALWHDELKLYNWVTQYSFKEMISELYAHDTHPPFYYILMKLISYILPSTNFAIRLPSIIFSLISIYYVFNLGKKFFSKRAAEITAILIATTPYYVQISRDAMMYPLLFLFAAISSSLAYQLYKSPFSTRLAIKYTLVATLACYTHYYGILLIFCHALFFLTVFYRKRSRQVFYSGIAILLLITPWIPSVFSNMDFTKWWLVGLEKFIGDYLFYDYLNGTFLGYLLPTLAAFGFFRLVRNHKKELISGPVTYLTFVFLTPIAIIFIRSNYFQPIVSPKYLVIIIPNLYLITSFLISRASQNKFLHYFICTILLIFGTTSSLFVINDSNLHSAQKSLSNILIDQYKKNPNRLFVSRGLHNHYVRLQNHPLFFNENLDDVEHWAYIIGLQEVLKNEYNELVFTYTIKMPTNRFLKEISKRYDLVSQKLFFGSNLPAAITFWKKSPQQHQSP